MNDEDKKKEILKAIGLYRPTFQEQIKEKKLRDGGDGYNKVSFPSHHEKSLYLGSDGNNYLKIVLEDENGVSDYYVKVEKDLP